MPNVAGGDEGEGGRGKPQVSTRITIVRMYQGLFSAHAVREERKQPNQPPIVHAVSILRTAPAFSLLVMSSHRDFSISYLPGHLAVARRPSMCTKHDDDDKLRPAAPSTFPDNRQVLAQAPHRKVKNQCGEPQPQGCFPATSHPSLSPSSRLVSSRLVPPDHSSSKTTVGERERTDGCVTRIKVR